VGRVVTLAATLDNAAKIDVSWAHRRGPSATVGPYRFDFSPLAISYPPRSLPRQPYPSQDAFLHDYYTAPSPTITHTLQAA
jgi:hypothetical protein